MEPYHGKLITITIAPTEVEAAAIVAQLDAAGIPAHMEGGLTAGLRAEAPGNVQIIVREEDVERAAAILNSPS